MVRNGWDRASRIYRPDGTDRDAFGHDDRQHRDWLRPLLDELPVGARVLDLGCGCGVPDDRLLSERFSVTGVDISPVQIERARATVPRAHFVLGDMTTVEFEHGSFDAVVCLYSLIHVPLHEQEALLRRVRQWLRGGGWFVLMTGRNAFEGTEDDWLGSGATMSWSHADATTYRGWLAAAGFGVISETTVPEGEAAHELFHAKAE